LKPPGRKWSRDYRAGQSSYPQQEEEDKAPGKKLRPARQFPLPRARTLPPADFSGILGRGGTLSTAAAAEEKDHG